MKASVRSIVLTGMLVIGTNGLMAAQAASDWSEQLYRAKYGRNSPMEEARQKAERKNTALPEETTREVARPANDWAAQWYNAKFGRPSPTEEARQTAARGEYGAPATKLPTKWRGLPMTGSNNGTGLSSAAVPRSKRLVFRQSGNVDLPCKKHGPY